MTEKIKETQVSIIGGGFAGLNCALNLIEQDVDCEIFTTGYGASNLWAGTVDFLSFNSGSLDSNLEESYKKFQESVPNHPYYFLQYQEVTNAFDKFFSDFPEVKSFGKGINLRNQYALTSLGNLKPCIGIWKSIFHNFKELNNKSSFLMIDFKEFNNSTMNLIKKGLDDKFEGNHQILTLSFTELINSWETQDNKKSAERLSENRIGRYFDDYSNKVPQFANYIKEKIISDQISETFDYILFPPILGVEKNLHILSELSRLLKTKCFETIALSPSLMAGRLLDLYEKKLKLGNINIKKGYYLEELIREDTNNLHWRLYLKDRKGNSTQIKSNIVILATGSMFQAGMSEIDDHFRSKMNSLEIKVPNELTSNFELTKGSPSKNQTNIFVTGSAIYSFLESVSEEGEIKYGTGLGLAICSSYKTALAITNLLKE